MNLIPDLNRIKEISKTGEYTVVPVSTQILSDFITPIEALRILKNASDHVYMLESAKSDETWGRYTFLGFEPKMLITCKDGVLTAGDKTIKTDDPSSEIRKIMAEYKSPRVEELNFFTGGLVGYFSFEYFGYSEPTIRSSLEDENEFKDVDLMLFDKVIAFDNLSQKIHLIANIKLNDIENEYERAKGELKRIADLLRNGKKKEEPTSRLLGQIKPLFDRERFCQMVTDAKNYIREGDIFQIVLSNRLSAPFEGSLLDTYRELRTINPSPYMFYFSGTDVEVAGASPETLVKLKDGILHTFPLAGTRKRGATQKEDEELEAELLKDEKELAEHNLLVDLGRNDLGRISEFGSVEVEKLRSIERFSHVMHIGSTVRGRIRQDKDALSAIEAVMPAGTLSGAPKIRACELIGKLEGNKRGIYGGAIGYIDFNGNMDTCIAIRLVYRKGNTVFVRSGAGIVADSVPELEFEECMNKARASLRALESSSQGDEL
ncbi:MAG: anthranilate synthase component I family protein [Lachnospiraceae bacterium]|nr:anthranilate synthase component I family protein [Lachnospiraceae bacterium]